jgi:hypothetical protein
MRELTMNEMKDSMTGVDVHPVPLFASSWVALFCLLRSNFAKSRNEADAAIDPDRTGSGDTQH